MTEPAVDELGHPNRKLGKRPPQTGRRRPVMLRDVLTGDLPVHPPEADYLAGATFGMYGNDRYGTCGPTSVANSRRAVTYRLDGAMAAPTVDDVFDLYRRSGNPRFDPATGADDNGVYMHQMLDAVHADGIGGVRSIAHAAIDPDDRDTLRKATAVFGPATLWGLDLQAAQSGQFDRGGPWEYAPSGAWGGHAVVGGQYDPDSLGCISWTRPIDMTDRFVAEQADEVWVCIWPEHLRDRTFLAGVDVQALARTYRAATGRELPLPPAPAPTARLLPGLSPAAQAALDRRRRRHDQSEVEYVTARMEAYLR